MEGTELKECKSSSATQQFNYRKNLRRRGSWARRQSNPTSLVSDELIGNSRSTPSLDPCLVSSVPLAWERVARYFSSNQPAIGRTVESRAYSNLAVRGVLLITKYITSQSTKLSYLTDWALIRQWTHKKVHTFSVFCFTWNKSQKRCPLPQANKLSLDFF